MKCEIGMQWIPTVQRVLLCHCFFYDMIQVGLCTSRSWGSYNRRQHGGRWITTRPKNICCRRVPSKERVQASVLCPTSCQSDCLGPEPTVCWRWISHSLVNMHSSNRCEVFVAVAQCGAAGVSSDYTDLHSVLQHLPIIPSSSSQMLCHHSSKDLTFSAQRLWGVLHLSEWTHVVWLQSREVFCPFVNTSIFYWTLSWTKLLLRTLYTLMYSKRLHYGHNITNPSFPGQH